MSFRRPLRIVSVAPMFKIHVYRSQASNTRGLGINPTLPTYLHRLALLRPAQPVAYPTLRHVESNAAHPARQTAPRCDGEAIRDRHSRHQTGPAPYRDQIRPVGQLTSLLALDVQILTGQTYTYISVVMILTHQEK